MCLTHALAGALVGRFFRKPKRAFIAGVLSHIPLDMLPHFDSVLEVEVSTTALGLALVAGACGAKSPEFWGAIGGLLPDVEVALKNLGLLEGGRLLFPTHRFGFLHGGRFEAPVAQPIFWAMALFSLVAPRVFGHRRSRGRAAGRES